MVGFVAFRWSTSLQDLQAPNPELLNLYSCTQLVLRSGYVKFVPDSTSLTEVLHQPQTSGQMQGLQNLSVANCHAVVHIRVSCSAWAHLQHPVFLASLQLSRSWSRTQPKSAREASREKAREQFGPRGILLLHEESTKQGRVRDTRGLQCLDLASFAMTSRKLLVSKLGCGCALQIQHVIV